MDNADVRCKHRLENTSTKCNKQKANALTKDGQGVRARTIPEELGILQNTKNFVATGIPAKEKYKRAYINVTSELLERYVAEGNDFIPNILTGDECWFHHLNAETKQQPMERHHITSYVQRRGPKQCPQPGK
jgi:hypothetical protein